MGDDERADLRAVARSRETVDARRSGHAVTVTASEHTRGW